MEIINRTNELAHLEKEYIAQGSRFIVIYGRRRVGKTTLIKKFMENKEGVYYLAAEEKDFQQIEEFKTLLARKLDDKFLADHRFESWKELFSYLEQTWPKNRRMILAIDEVTFIIKSNPSFTSYLQKFYDEFLSKTDTFLILSGSLVGVIVEKVLDESSPLYGRRTSQMLLTPFGLKDASKFMKGFSFVDKIRIYGIIGGVAKYLTMVKDSKTFNEFLADGFFNKEGFFYPEGVFILSQEFREPSMYIDMMKAVAFGKTKLNDIATFSGTDTKKTSGYLDILITLGLVRRLVPITERERGYRGGIYEVNDHFLKFWHKFVYPNRSQIEFRKKEEVLKRVLPELDTYLGKIFEQICLEYTERRMFGSYSSFGKWWGDYYSEKDEEKKAVEIDVVALDDEKRKILFGECKWSDDVDAAEILSSLKEKATHVEWNKKDRIEEYIIFARSFKKRSVEGCTLVDLKILEKEFE